MKQSKFYIAFVLVFSLLIVAQNCRLRAVEPAAHRPGHTGPDVVAQLNGLSQALDKGGAERMQELFPEGYIFTWVLYGLAWVQVGMNESGELRERAVEEARRAANAIDSPQGRAPFDHDMEPAWGVFYNGWLAWLVGGLIAISEDPEESDVQLFVELCDRVATALQNDGTPFLHSYPGQSWPADTVVAIAALRLHDHLLTPRFEDVTETWLENALERIDRTLDLLAHRSDPASGYPTQSGRGSSVALMLRFLVDIDPDLAVEHYSRFRKHFAAQHAGMVVGFREYPHGRDDGWADVDSGPIIFGYSGPATVVGMGTALLFSDFALSDPILRGIDLVGLPHSWGQTKRYGAGFLPVGEAFVVWSKTARPFIVELPETKPFEPVVGRYWLWRWHVLSLAVLLVVWSPVLAKARLRRRINLADEPSQAPVL